MQMITVFTAFNPAEAQLVRSRLDAAQFHPEVKNEISALSMEGYALAAGGIQVQVPEAEAKEAREFVNAPTGMGLVTRWGGCEENPSAEQLRAALAELEAPDPEHPNTWFVDEEGWLLDVYDNGLVIFAEKDRVICRRNDVSRVEALELWLLLQQGRRDQIREKLSA